MTINYDQIVREFEQLLGTKPYFSANRLVQLGLFGSPAALYAAIHSGKIPAIKVTGKRFAVPRTAVVEYFRNSLMTEKQCVAMKG